jgi:hypothetical protein
VKLFRIESSGQFRGIDDVAKQRGDLPAFAMQRGRKRIAGRRLLRDLGTALAAKECVDRIGCTAPLTDHACQSARRLDACATNRPWR